MAFTYALPIGGDPVTPGGQAKDVEQVARYFSPNSQCLS